MLLHNSIKDYIVTSSVINRSKVDIISQILEVAKNGTGKSRVMYGAFLSFTQLREYLKVLFENGLLDYDATTRKYKTTEKGLRFLALVSHMYRFVNEDSRVFPRTWAASADR